MRFLWIAVGIALFALGEASADPLPAATYSVRINNSTIDQPGSYSGSGELAEIVPSPDPTVHAHVSGLGTSVVQMIYWFRIDGPGNTQVPIQISGNVSINAGGANFVKDYVWGVTAQLIAQSFNGPLGPGVEQIDNQFVSIDCNPLSVGNVPVSPPIPSCAAISQDEDVVLNLTVLTGADNRIAMNAATNNQENFVANFDSVVDPIISFAPGFDPTGYEILTSDGVGNAVPEPASVWLFGLLPILGGLRGARRWE